MPIQPFNTEDIKNNHNKADRTKVRINRSSFCQEIYAIIPLLLPWPKINAATLVPEYELAVFISKG